MTDKKYEKEKARVKAIFDKWKKVFGLQQWHIDFEYERDDFHKDEEKSHSNKK